MSSKPITIGVNQGILWIGGEAYPLHNIARVQNVQLVPGRGRAAGTFVKQLLIWVVLGVGGVAGLRFADLTSSDAATYTEYIGIGVGTLVLISLIRLLIVLLRRTYHALVIETSGTPHTTSTATRTSPSTAATTSGSTPGPTTTTPRPPRRTPSVS